MQKDDRFYTFLFTHSSRSKIYIRRLEVSKKWLHTCAASSVLTIGIAAAGIAGMANAEGFSAANLLEGKDKNVFTAQLTPGIPKTIVESEVKPLNYDRPEVPESLTSDSGGPTNNQFRLSNDASSAEEDAMEAELKNIEKTSNPDFIPTMWAHMGKINNEFGFRRNPFGGRSYEFHPGIDIDGEKGDIVVAPANGVVVKAGWNNGYGNLIEIDHGNGIKTRYGHLSKINVNEGDTIQRGEEMALVGSTGRSTGPHLHYELRLNDKAINPRRFLPPEMPN